ncbi:MAG: hypothetical protein ABR587_08375 [Candidatus Binatia bacterium]
MRRIAIGAVACFLLTPSPMYLKEALLRCSRLEDEVASIYDAVACSATATPELAASWSERSRRERRRARLLHALAEISTALEDDGPFLVEAPVQLAGLGRVLENARRQLASMTDGADGQRCLDTIETAPLRELHAALLEAAEPEIKRASRLVDSEIRNLRRISVGARSRRKTRPREAGAELPAI